MQNPKYMFLELSHTRIATIREDEALVRELYRLHDANPKPEDRRVVSRGFGGKRRFYSAMMQTPYQEWVGVKIGNMSKDDACLEIALFHWLYDNIPRLRPNLPKTLGLLEPDEDDLFTLVMTDFSFGNSREVLEANTFHKEWDYITENPERSHMEKTKTTFLTRVGRRTFYHIGDLNTISGDLNREVRFARTKLCFDHYKDISDITIPRI